MDTVAFSGKHERQSGVELLKILGMFLIVVSHVTQTLGANNAYVTFHEYSLGTIENATTNPVRLLMAGLLYGGVLGNNIFFFCSVWFLVDKTTGSNQKIPRVLSDVWAVSVLILCVFAVCLRGNLDGGLVFRQFFPVIFQNNWYITNYLLFLPLYPALNEIIRRFDQKSLLRTVLFLLGLLCFFHSFVLYQWVTYYFVIAYVKCCLRDYSANVRLNAALLLCSLAGIAASIVLGNGIGLRVVSLSGLLTLLRQMYNPLVILTALSLLNLALRIPAKSRAVNYISSMSLFVYLIHENSLVCSYLRPWIWQKIYIGGGYSHIILCIFTFSAVLFLCSLAASVFYAATIQKVVWRVSDALFARVFRLWAKLENRLLSLH